MSRFACLSLACALAAGCADMPDQNVEGEIDGINDDVGDGKADTGGVRDGTQDAYAVVTFANLATLADLRAAGLGSTAAKNIIAYRLGDDMKARTDDDAWFETLREVDAVPYVGPQAFKAMVAYTRGKLEYTRPLFDGRWIMVIDRLPEELSPIEIWADFKVQDDGALTRELHWGTDLVPVSWSGVDFRGFVVATAGGVVNGQHYEGTLLTATAVNGQLMCGTARVWIEYLGAVTSVTARLTAVRATGAELPDTSSLCP